MYFLKTGTKDYYKGALIMKAHGVIRRIDHLGRVVIPKDFRRTNCIQDGDPVEITCNADNEIVIRKYDPHKDLSSHIDYLTEQIEIYKFDLEKNKKVLNLFEQIKDVLKDS